MKNTQTGSVKTRIIVFCLMLALAASIPAQGLTFGVGSNTTTLIQQTWPITFSESAIWLTGGVWTPGQSFGVEAGFAVFDLNSMRLRTPLAYYLDVDWEPFASGSARAGTRIGFVHIPSSGWFSPYVAGAYTSDVTSSIRLSTSLGIQWTEGRAGYSSAWCIWIAATVYWLSSI